MGIRELLHDVSLEKEVLDVRQCNLGLALLDGNNGFPRELSDIARDNCLVDGTCSDERPSWIHVHNTKPYSPEPISSLIVRRERGTSHSSWAGAIYSKFGSPLR